MSSPCEESPVALFRVDATKSSGLGHALRCTALAQAWSDAGGTAKFAMQHKTGFLDEVFSSEGWEVESLDSANPEYTATLSSRCEAEWVVLDGYQFGADFEEELRSRNPGSRYLVIDDRLRDTHADLFVIPSFPVECDDWDGSARLLGGWKYALIRREFRNLPDPVPADSPVIFVVLGGTDSADLLSAVSKSLAEVSEERGWKVRIVSSQPVPDSLERVEPGRNLPGEMSGATVVVCTASTVALEACALGIPQVLLVVADNQIPVADSLVSSGAALLADGPSSVPGKVSEILAGKNQETMAEVARTLVDGEGANRIARAMMAWDVSLRPVSGEDSELLRIWANDPVVRAASFHSEKITEEVHKNWFQKRLTDPDTWMRVALDRKSRPFGLLRIEGIESPFLSISIQETHRGLGLGEKLLIKGCEAYFQERSAKSIFAEVKPENKASRQIFENAGFSMIKSTDERMTFQRSAA